MKEKREEAGEKKEKLNERCRHVRKGGGRGSRVEMEKEREKR